MLNENNNQGQDDSWLVKEAAAAMNDYARTVTSAPPLRLTARFSLAALLPAAPRGARRWQGWLVPVTVAAVVAALAFSLVLVRDIRNGGAVPVAGGPPRTGAGAVSPASSSTTNPSLGGVPRYYLAVQTEVSKPAAGKPPKLTSSLVAGDLQTGTKVAFPPLAGVRFLGVAAAGDDRTFVATGQYGSGASATAMFFKVQLIVKTGHPLREATMSTLPVKAQPVGTKYSLSHLGDSLPFALSASGKQLAVAEFTGDAGMAVKFFSVVTGKLLGQLTTTDRILSAAGLSELPTLTWIDGDKYVALATLGAAQKKGPGDYEAVQAVRRLTVDIQGSGLLVAGSPVLRYAWVGGKFGSTSSCGYQLQWPPVISADGKTFTCTTGAAFLTYPMNFSRGRGVGVVDLKTGPNEFVSNLLWAGKSGDTIIAEWGVQDDGTVHSGGKFVQIDAISHGKATPLHFPKGFKSRDMIAW